MGNTQAGEQSRPHGSWSFLSLNPSIMASVAFELDLTPSTPPHSRMAVQ